MSDSKEILKTKFIEHFLFDYTDKDEYEVRMLSEIFEGIYYQKDKHFKSESKYWQVFRCLADQQAIIDDLKAQLNNMEACYIEKKKECEELQGRVGEALEEIQRALNCCESTETACVLGELVKVLRGDHE